MQDSSCKLTIENAFKKYWGVIIACMITPVLLYAILQILPTHDDWTSLTTPDFREFFIKERFLFYGYHWRPFDSMIGYVAGRNPQVLFPLFNHLLVIAGHLLCTITIFKLLTALGFGQFSKNIRHNSVPIVHQDATRQIHRLAATHLPLNTLQGKRSYVGTDWSYTGLWI